MHVLICMCLVCMYCIHCTWLSICTHLSVFCQLAQISHLQNDLKCTVMTCLESQMCMIKTSSLVAHGLLASRVCRMPEAFAPRKGCKAWLAVQLSGIVHMHHLYAHPAAYVSCICMPHLGSLFECLWCGLCVYCLHAGTTTAALWRTTTWPLSSTS